MRADLSIRHLAFAVFSIALLLLLRDPVIAAAGLSARDEHHSHLVLMPFISFGLIYLHSSRIFQDARYVPSLGFPLVAGGGLLAYWAGSPPLENLSAAMTGVVFAWIGGFLSVYGTGPLSRSRFPLAMLCLAAPLPASVIETIEVALQHASADVTHVIFQLTGTTMFRDGLVFSLPGVKIEVARECSGIRSSIALLITGLILAHLFLRSAWAKALLIVLTVPITILKNAARIATISWMGTYVSQEYFYGDLHRRGGLPFSVLALALLIPCLLVLRKWESPSPGTASRAVAAVTESTSAD